MARMMVAALVVPRAAPKSRQGGKEKEFVMHAFVGAHLGKVATHSLQSWGLMPRQCGYITFGVSVIAIARKKIMSLQNPW